MNTRNDKADLKDLHLMLIVFAVVVCCAISFSAGKKNQQKETENRANKSNNIEYIVFGEQQL